MGAKKRFRRHVAEIMQEVQLDGQALESIDFRKSLAMIKVAPTAKYPDAAPFILAIPLKSAPTKYHVLRQMLEAGLTHIRYDGR